MNVEGKRLMLAAMLLIGSSAHSAGEVAPRHLIYLHGRIVQEQQDPRPKHPVYGYYELEKILDTFRRKGFVVSGGIRPKGASPSESADRVVEEVRHLLESGVPADHVTVVGASMGGEIALEASTKLQNPDVRFVVLGACVSETSEHLAGRILAIREASDEFTHDCPASPEAHEIVLHSGLGHGFLYRPMPAWVGPTVEWAQR